jgi:hypothetical protein
VLRSTGQNLEDGRLGRGEARGPVIGHERAGKRCIDTRNADQRLRDSGIERQSASEKIARLRHAVIQVHRVRIRRQADLGGIRRVRRCCDKEYMTVPA